MNGFSLIRMMKIYHPENIHFLGLALIELIYLTYLLYYARSNISVVPVTIINLNKFNVRTTNVIS